MRAEIASKAREIFADISSDVQRFWEILQPSATISSVRLLVSDDSDKAIEVALNFHGTEQDSPRLTLSEGQRNALGLCIFLAMASRANETERPIVLDDVVISFDRDHRSRVYNLIAQEFGSRQVIMFTHDREWYFELQRLLSHSRWRFFRLLPYAAPEVGIAFADHALDLDAAKQRVANAPEEALGNMRRIVDVALGEIAERVSLPIPFVRGDGNDHRTAGQFLVALEKATARCFRTKVDGNYVSNSSALEAIRKSKPELAIWGNRGTHTFSGSVREATDLIDSCEAVLNSFVCQDCNTALGMVKVAGNKRECRCGRLQWKSD